MNFSEYYPAYFTATILDWKHLLKPDKYKNIIVSDLAFLVKEKKDCFVWICHYEQPHTLNMPAPPQYTGAIQ